MNNSISKYKITNSQEKELWANCIFVFDSSALLNFYEYSETTRKDIFKTTFKVLENRLWIPSYVNREFIRNRNSTLKKPIRHYQSLKNTHLKAIEENFNQIKNKTKKANKHPYLDSKAIEEFEKHLSSFKEELINGIKNNISEINNMSENDTVLKNFEKFFEIGNTYNYNQLTSITKEGDFRYKYQIPPGYMDEKDKTGFDIFGDLIIWKQILDYSKEIKKPIVFITDDLKEDWWILNKNRQTISPREELIDEIQSYSNMDFWMYDSSQFLDKSREILKTDIKKEAIDEVKNTRLQFYGVSAEHAFYGWLIKRFEVERDKLVSTFVSQDTGIDFVISDKEVNFIEAFSVKYIRETSIKYMRIRIKQALNEFLNTLTHLSKPQMKMSLALITSTSKSALKIVKELEKKSDQTSLFPFENTEIDYIIGYIDDLDFIEFKTIKLKGIPFKIIKA